MVLGVPYGQDANRKFACGYECRTKLTDVPGMGRFVQNSQQLRVRVLPVKNRLEGAKEKNNFTGMTQFCQRFSDTTAIGILHALMIQLYGKISRAHWQIIRTVV